MARDLHRVAERMKSSPWAGNPRNEMEAFNGNILVMGTYWKTIDSACFPSFTLSLSSFRSSIERQVWFSSMYFDAKKPCSATSVSLQSPLILMQSFINIFCVLWCASFSISALLFFLWLMYSFPYAFRSILFVNSLSSLVLLFIRVGLWKEQSEISGKLDKFYLQTLSTENMQDFS